jgi:hypothetical protein
MTEERQGGGSWALVAILWACVLIPLAWAVYQTLTSVVALFAG